MAAASAVMMAAALTPGEPREAVILTLHKLDAKTCDLVREFSSSELLRLHVVYDADRPHHGSHNSHALEASDIRCRGMSADPQSIVRIPARRKTEYRAYGKAYKTFAGIYGAPVKPAAIRWLAKSELRRAWIVEADAFVIGGRWEALLWRYRASNASLIVPRLGFDGHMDMEARYPSRWHWRRCSICAKRSRRGAAEGRQPRHAAALLPVIRVDRALARLCYGMLGDGHTGHHEVFLPTLAAQHARELGGGVEDMASRGDVGVVRWRPDVHRWEARAALEKAASRHHAGPKLLVFHPLKTLKEWSSSSEADDGPDTDSDMTMIDSAADPSSSTSSEYSDGRSTTIERRRQPTVAN